jgi:hypothetical protein
MQNKKRSLLFLMLFSMSALFGAAESGVTQGDEEEAGKLFFLVKEKKNVNSQVKGMSREAQWECFFKKIAAESIDIETPGLVTVNTIITKIGNLSLFGQQASGSSNQEKFENFVKAARAQNEQDKKDANAAEEAEALKELPQTLVDLCGDNSDVEIFKKKFNAAPEEVKISVYLQVTNSSQKNYPKSGFVRDYADITNEKRSFGFVNKVIETLVSKKGPADLQTKDEIIKYFKENGFVNHVRSLPGSFRERTTFEDYIGSSAYSEFPKYSGLVRANFGNITEDWPRKKDIKDDEDDWVDKGQEREDDDALVRRKNLVNRFQGKRDEVQVKEHIITQDEVQKEKAKNALHALFAKRSGAPTPKPSPSSSSAPDSVDDPELPPPLPKRDNQASVVKIKEKNQQRYNELVTQGFDLLARRVNLPMWTPGKKIGSQNQLINEMNAIGKVYFEK